MEVVSLQAIKHFSYEERSAAFFALGRARASGRPVAIITGTAAGELLQATMEAFYTEDPLLLITADRPRRYRGTGAPQAAEQAGIFGVYAPFSQDLEHVDPCAITEWDWVDPAHLNVCIEDPLFQHIHDYDFAHFAKSWCLPYVLCEGCIPIETLPRQAFIELRPDAEATESFWSFYDGLRS
jgi:2-succinyl-5-enolpyruvyl-6-hydroxy-3-cyclohexene-1-carboxylate synthase